MFLELSAVAFFADQIPFRLAMMMAVSETVSISFLQSLPCVKLVKTQKLHLEA